MNWAFFRKNIWLLTILAFLMGLPTFAEARHHKKHKHSHSSHKGHKNNSCKNLQRIEQILKNLNSQAPISINQKKIDSAGGNLILTQAGDYCVTENIVGTLVIGTDSICLDLCCHTLNANGAPNAIVANGHQALKVFNGRIINSTDAGILVTSYSAVELYDLEMSNHTLDAIWQNNSTDLNVHDVAFVNSNSGERALLFNTCNNISVNRCQATGFRSTIGAIIQLDSCNTASIQDVDVTNNTKSPVAPNGTLDTNAALVNLNDCTGVDLVHVKVNNNTINNTIVGTRRFSAIAFVSSNNCSMLRSETCNNIDINGDVGNDITQGVALTRQVTVALSDNVLIKEHQANNNSCPTIIGNFRIYNTRDSNNTVFEECQANSNFVQELLVDPTGGPGGFATSEYEGFKLQFANSVPNGCALRNCQANFNVLAKGGAGRSKVDVNWGFLNAIETEGSCIIEGCQACFNSIGDSENATFLGGIVALFGASNVTISNCSADNNTGGEVAVGINFGGSEGLECANCTVTHCTGNANGNFGLLIGTSYDTSASLTHEVKILDSVFYKNGNTLSDSAGIAVLKLTPNASNILIKGCEIYDTFSEGGKAAGINVSNASNVVIEDTNIFNTTATGFEAHGILLNTVADSKIIRTQLHGNQDSGVELVGNNPGLSIIESLAIDNNIGFNFTSGSTAACSLVQDSRALNNAKAGFKYGAALPLTVTFIGNEAQCNGTTAGDNYKGLGGHISLQELKLSDGSLTSINPAGAGTAALGARFTNIRVVP